MPQLDIATFLGQSTWLTVVFMGFYLIMVGSVLPLLSRALKLRAKKLDLQRTEVLQRGAEGGVRVAVEASYDSAHADHGKKLIARLGLRRLHLEGSEVTGAFSMRTAMLSRSRSRSRRSALSAIRRVTAAMEGWVKKRSAFTRPKDWNARRAPARRVKKLVSLIARASTLGGKVTAKKVGRFDASGSKVTSARPVTGSRGSSAGAASGTKKASSKASKK